MMKTKLKKILSLVRSHVLNNDIEASRFMFGGLSLFLLFVFAINYS